MLTIPKSATCFSTANINKTDGSVNLPKKGNLGRQELFVDRTDDGYQLTFEDKGNYGRTRWIASFQDLNETDLVNMVSDLQALIDGDIDSTKIEFIAPQPTEAVEVQAEPIEETQELEAETTEVPVEALETEATEDTEQLEA